MRALDSDTELQEAVGWLLQSHPASEFGWKNPSASSRPGIVKSFRARVCYDPEKRLRFRGTGRHKGSPFVRRWVFICSQDSILERLGVYRERLCPPVRHQVSSLNFWVQGCGGSHVSHSFTAWVRCLNSGNWNTHPEAVWLHTNKAFLVAHLPPFAANLSNIWLM